MTSSIQELLDLVPIPENPKNAQGDWAATEADLGLELPEDYKQFVNHYGMGTLGYLWIPSPFNCVEPLKKQPQSAREYWSSWSGIYDSWGKTPNRIPYGVYPTIPGLFPLALYGDVDVLSWNTNGKSSNWNVVYFSRGNEFFELKMGFVGFLISAVKGTTPLPERVFGKHMSVAPQEFISG